MQQVDSFLGEIRPVSFNFAPAGWLICDGSLLNIQAYELLYALIGTTYGGDGAATFALPDLRGRLPIGQGQGTNPDGSRLTSRALGQYVGTETVALDGNTLPTHNHALNVSSASGNLLTPNNNYPAATAYKNYFNNPAGPYVAMDPLSVESYGSNYAHNNMMPFLALNYIICIDGDWPSQQ